MVGRAAALAGLAALASPALAQGPWDQIFPDPESCYLRSYTADHLTRHPQQRVTRITLAAVPDAPTDPLPAVKLRVDLRGPDGGTAEAVAYCEEVPDRLSCGMEGDAGVFTVTSTREDAILVAVGPDGMALETDRGFVTLDAERGDDRRFLLWRGPGCG
jgi:hypothetical protein